MTSQWHCPMCGTKQFSLTRTLILSGYGNVGTTNGPTTATSKASCSNCGVGCDGWVADN